MCDIPINLVFEDTLSEAVLQKLLALSGRSYVVGICYNGQGFGWIEKRVMGFNNAAKGMPYLILTDLDREECAPLLLGRWLKHPRHANLLLRVAVKEVEAWILGCRCAFAQFLGIDDELIPRRVDEIGDPKEFVVSLARRSRRRDVRVGITPAKGSTARVGPDYNGRMIEFVQEYWAPEIAEENSPSLRRTRQILTEFEPVWERLH